MARVRERTVSDMTRSGGGGEVGGGGMPLGMMMLVLDTELDKAGYFDSLNLKVLDADGGEIS
jgi:hypothetical protein